MPPVSETATSAEQGRERAVLVAAQVRDPRATGAVWTAAASLDELAQLAATAGIAVEDRLIQSLEQANPVTYVGKGKLEELRLKLAGRPEVRTVLFDDELTPGQQRHIERLLGDGIKIVDRTALILDIFAQHARSREGQIQVELAQCEYLQPRLAGMWRHLFRQAGGRAGGAIGVGLRGPGETQLESDRRVIRRRIASLQRELEEVRRARQQHYRHRRRRQLKSVALVGYTNAGKSSLLNAICYDRLGGGRRAGAAAPAGPPRAHVADQLFATLDPTTRRVRLPKGTQVLFTDTVGFITKLPDNLKTAFRATLEGIDQADLLLHVVDISHPHADAQAAAVRRILSDLGLADRPTLVVWNKIDAAAQPGLRPEGRGQQPIAVSALEGIGLDRLLEAVEARLRSQMVRVEIEIPYELGALKSRLFAEGSVQWYDDGPCGTRIRALVPPDLAATLAALRQA